MSRLRAEVDYLTSRIGLQGYCWACDSHRWAWTHRRCARRAHTAGAEVARLVNAAIKNGWRP